MGNINALGGIIKRIDNYDKMESFEGRLKLQKSIYLMQIFDLFIGYNFSWYIRGPYSSELTKDGYALINIYDELPEARFKEKAAEMRFSNFVKFLKGRHNDANWLEIIASIHFLRSYYPSLPPGDILQIVKNKQSYFTEEQCRDGWEYLRGWRKI